LFERLGRYETALWRQLAHTLFLLSNLLDVADGGRSWDLRSLISLPEIEASQFRLWLGVDGISAGGTSLKQWLCL
jgi:hypothetical protein